MRVSHGGLLIPLPSSLVPGNRLPQVPATPAHTAANVPIVCCIYYDFFVGMQDSVFPRWISCVNA